MDRGGQGKWREREGERWGKLRVGCNILEKNKKVKEEKASYITCTALIWKEFNPSTHFKSSDTVGSLVQATVTP